jgi:hypothetical protein
VGLDFAGAALLKAPHMIAENWRASWDKTSQKWTFWGTQLEAESGHTSQHFEKNPENFWSGTFEVSFQHFFHREQLKNTVGEALSTQIAPALLSPGIFVISATKIDVLRMPSADHRLPIRRSFLQITLARMIGATSWSA